MDPKGAGFLSKALDLLIVWLVALIFLPWILRERYRRYRERRSGAGAETERAVRDVMRRIHVELRRGEGPADAGTRGGVGAGKSSRPIAFRNTTAGVSAGPPVVAVVDDEEAVRRSMERVLRTAGYGVTTFADGADFVESLRSARPSCVLLDLVMPWMSGRDVLSHLQRQAVRVPAIIVTGRHTQQARRLATIGGATAYFTKPVDAAALLAEIGIAIGDTRADGA